MSLFGFRNMDVTTRAVAGITNGQACIWVKNNLNVQGNAGICGIDPKNQSAWTGKCGSGGTCPATGAVMACGIYVGGSITGSGGGGGSNCIASSYIATSGSVGVNLNPSPAIANAPAMTPPDFLTQAPMAPTDPKCTGNWNPGNMTVTSTASGNGNNKPNVLNVTLGGASGTTAIAAGCYGMDANLPAGTPAGWNASNTVMNVTLQNASLGAGTYLFNLGTALSTPGTLNIGSNVGNTTPPTSFDSGYQYGVTLDVYTGNFSVASTSTNINLYAPSDTSYLNGILLQEPLSNTGTIDIQWGSASSNFYGYIVGPGATLTMQDQGGGAIVSGLYVGNMTANSELGVVNYNTKVAGAPGKTIALVE
jgi:hypothetical protein